MTHLEAYIEALNMSSNIEGKFIVRSYSKRMSGFGMDFSLIRELYYMKNGVTERIFTVQKREFVKNIEDKNEYENERMDIFSISEINKFLKSWQTQ